MISKQTEQLHDYLLTTPKVAVRNTYSEIRLSLPTFRKINDCRFLITHQLYSFAEIINDQLRMFI